MPYSPSPRGSEGLPLQARRIVWDRNFGVLKPVTRRACGDNTNDEGCISHREIQPAGKLSGKRVFGSSVRLGTRNSAKIAASTSQKFGESPAEADKCRLFSRFGTVAQKLAPATSRGAFFRETDKKSFRNLAAEILMRPANPHECLLCGRIGHQKKILRKCEMEVDV